MKNEKQSTLLHITLFLTLFAAVLTGCSSGSDSNGSRPSQQEFNLPTINP